ncbi:MAG: ATP-binding protein [Muricauda sp.]|nr:ATP-binding protein [Allomuricauda sp.]MBA4744080.1 ATP-binding protein [Allomuricauda sp.]
MKKSFEKEFDWKQYFIVSENFVRQKEHSEIEFKESFHSPKHKDKKLLKWIASFSNANGGLILYGVKNNGELVGLKNDKLEQFDNKDLSQELLSYFAPEIHFELFIKEIDGLKIGFLYIYKSQNKPIVAIKTANNNIQESDIFYRYPGQSRRISYGDLRNMIEEREKKLNDNWLNLMNNVATIGVENIGLLNVMNGELIGSKNKLLIPEELLKKVSFINEGKFVEKDGAPTLKLIGDVQPIDSNKIVQLVENKYHIITHFELFNSFFEQKLDSDSASEFFRKVVHENTVYYPIYFYIEQSKLSKKQVLDLLKNSKGNKVNDIKKRFKIEKNNLTKFKIGNISTGTEAAKKITNAIRELKSDKKIDFKTVDTRELRYYIQAITHLKKEEINKDYIMSVLKDIYDNHFNQSATTKSFIRKAICHIDLIFYGENYFGQ